MENIKVELVQMMANLINKDKGITDGEKEGPSGPKPETPD